VRTIHRTNHKSDGCTYKGLDLGCCGQKAAIGDANVDVQGRVPCTDSKRTVKDMAAHRRGRGLRAGGPRDLRGWQGFPASASEKLPPRPAIHVHSRAAREGKWEPALPHRLKREAMHPAHLQLPPTRLLAQPLLLLAQSPQDLATARQDPGSIHINIGRGPRPTMIRGQP